MMKKLFKYYAICWFIALAVFNIVAFVVTDNTLGISNVTASFWIAYAFITLAFCGNLGCSVMFFKEENKNKVFLNLPIIYYAFGVLVVSLIVGAIAMAIPVIPYWVGIVVDVFVLAFYAIAIIKAVSAAGMVEAIDKKIKTKTFFIKSLTVDAESLVARAQSGEAKSAAKKVYEAIRYSDPMSSEALASAETQITLKFNQFAEAVTADDSTKVKEIAQELIILVDDRNKKCKLLK